MQRQHATLSLSLSTRARLPHSGQRKKLQPPPLGKRMCQRPTSRDSPAIVTRTEAIASVTSPVARSRETDIEGQSSCVTLPRRVWLPRGRPRLTLKPAESLKRLAQTPKPIYRPIPLQCRREMLAPFALVSR